MSRLIISVHVPKTAGTSFGSYLKQRFNKKMLMCYPCERCKTHLFDYELKNLQERFLAPCSTHKAPYEELASFVKSHKIECIHGHIKPADLYPHFPWARFVVWLRDPVERTLSHFEFLRRRQDLVPNRVREAVTEGNLLEFARVFANHQSMILEGFTLKKCYFVGIAEESSQEMRRFSRAVGIPAGDMPQENINPSKGVGKYKMDTEVRAALQGINSADLRLYQEALRLRGNENSILNNAWRLAASFKTVCKLRLKAGGSLWK